MSVGSCVAFICMLAACEADIAGSPLEIAEAVTTDASGIDEDVGISRVLQPDSASIDSVDSLPPTYPKAPKFIGGERWCEYVVPKQYRADTSWPLIVLLHGYQVDGVLQDMFFGLSQLVDELGFLMIRPNGTIDSQGYHFWDATMACCNRDQTNIDDVGYIHSLIDEMEMYFNIDRARIYLMGHSNGGFMSYRLACDSGERFAGLMSLAGATFYNEDACISDIPLAVLQVHGTDDSEIDYNGGKIKNIMPYPSAFETVASWAAKNGCGESNSLPNIDIDSDLSGAETSVEHWSDCTSGYDVALWTIQDGKHIPGVYDGRFARAAIEFLFAHRREVTESR